MSASPFLSAYATSTSTSTCSPTASSSSPPPADCTSLLRSLWSDLSHDVMSVSTTITSWLTSMTSSTTCTTCTSCTTVKQPQRLTIDEWFHWYQHHRHTYIRSLPRAPHQRRRSTYLLHDDESDDEDLDNWDENLLTSQHHQQIQQQHRHDEMYEPQTCLCQHTSQNVTRRSTTLMVAACAGMYERSSLKHEEFIAPRHLGVAIDDVTIAPVSPSSLSSSSSSCDDSSAISIPSSPNSARSSSWSSDDDSDVDIDMTRSSSPEYHLRRCDSASSLSMDDDESGSECEHMTSEYLDVATSTKQVDKSALRRRSSSTQHPPCMSRSTSMNRFDPSTSTPSSIIPKVRRLMTPTSTSPLPSSSSTDDLMQRLWSIHDGHELSTMQQSLRDTSIAI